MPRCRLTVTRFDLDAPVTLAADAWNRALREPTAPVVHSVRIESPTPRAISIPIGSPQVRVRSFFFAAKCDAASEPISGTGPGFGLKGLSAKPPQSKTVDRSPSGFPASRTRIKPPGDVIKLEDRLHYLLQPTLESLLAERSLSMPFPPFPFQFDGVAFLYPRHAAILADEMGLGKTMQSITAIRLLLRRGEVQKRAFGLPQALVTNWQREFSLWAPEIPVLAIEGDQSRRIWQWQLPDVPVRIANYEVVCRDRQVWSEPGSDVRFDLVVLDESQRIKNRASTTSEVVCSIPRRRSWALTGTPVENSAEDLVGIFEFLAPGFLSPDMKPRAMGRTVHDYVLRRTKDQVLTELPPKLFRDADLELTPPQREAYQLAQDEGVLKLTEMG